MPPIKGGKVIWLKLVGCVLAYIMEIAVTLDSFGSLFGGVS